MSQATRVAVYSISGLVCYLKNTTDDALPPFLRIQKRFSQNYILSDARLVMGYAAVLIAAITFYLDYKTTWTESKVWTSWAVVLYFLLNSALTVWIWGVEKGKVFIGNKGNLLVSIASSITRFDPIYRLKIRYSDPADPAGLQGQVVEIECSFTKWFTAEGQFIPANFHQWLEASVPFLNGRTDTVREKKQKI